MNYNDKELTLEELNEVKAGIIKGQDIDMINKLSKEELEQLKTHIVEEKELFEEELDIVKGGIPYEEGKRIADENPEIFRK